MAHVRGRNLSPSPYKFASIMDIYQFAPMDALVLIQRIWILVNNGRERKKRGLSFLKRPRGLVPERLD